jgi:hypothetical glycosyl hydrolase
MMRYDQGKDELENWLVEECAFDARHQGKYEAVFCQGNGYLGQRAALEESYVGQTRNLFVAGTFNKAGTGDVTELPNLPDLTHLSIRIGGHRFSMDQGSLSEYSRVMNLKTGELTRSLVWASPEGRHFALRFSRCVSMADPHLLGAKISVTALDGASVIRIESGIDGRVTNTGAQHFHEGDKRVLDKTILRMRSFTTESGIRCTLHAAHRYLRCGQETVPELLPLISRRCMALRAVLTLEAGETLTVEKLCRVDTDRDRDAITPDEAADTLRAAMKRGYDTLLADSAQVWEGLWKRMDVTVDSERPYDQLAIRFALYHLNIMVKKDDSRVGIAAKGLTGEGYKGHSFWDTEIFILPYFMLTQPETARTLLEYRYACLSGARKKAAENGYEGAMYPWESAWADDGETTPRWGAADVTTGSPMEILTGVLEQHITADIPYAVAQYFAATGDQDFMDRFGYEIFIDTARFWVSRATWDHTLGKAVILNVIGPDEYKEHVDKNAYANYMAHHNLKLALDAIDTLEARSDATAVRLNAQFDLPASHTAIRRLYDTLYLPPPDRDGILPQFDRYFSLKPIDLAKYKRAGAVGAIYHDYNIEQISGFMVSKQADVLVLLLLMDDLLSAEQKRGNFLFYEARTLHDSSLSKSTHSVLASDLGMKALAYDFFRDVCDTDLGSDMQSSDMGIHSASLGGLWQCAVFGFGGVRVTGGALHITPGLPDAWRSLSFPLVWRGQPLRVHAGRGSVHVMNLGTQTVQIILAGVPTQIPPAEEAQHTFA